MQLLFLEVILTASCLQRIKCDEALPHCSQCTRRRYDCPGYRRPLKWSSKYEVFGNEGSQQPEASRRSRSNDTARKSVRTEVHGGGEDEHARISAEIWGSQSPMLATEEITASPFCTLTSLSDLDAWATKIDNGFAGQGREDLANGFTGWFDPAASLEVPLDEVEDTYISRYYFSTVCLINSCFDSYQNYFRMEVGGMMSTRPLIYHCVLSMSAAHLSAKRSSLVLAALDHRTKAISCLTGEIMKAKEAKGMNHCLSSDSIVEVLLASILLGMTEVCRT